MSEEFTPADESPEPDAPAETPGPETDAADSAASEPDATPLPDTAPPPAEATTAPPSVDALVTGAPADGRPREERLREAGQLVILRLLAMVRVGKAYRVGNQAFRAQLDLFLGAIQPIAVEFDEMVLVALDTDFYLNGVRIPITRNSLKHHQAALKELQQRKIAGIRAEPEVTHDELETFFDLFLQPDQLGSTALLEAVVAAGCVHFQPVIYASTDAHQAEAMHIPGYSDGFDPWSQAGKLGGESFSGGASAVAEAARHDAPGHSPKGTAPKNYNIAIAGARSLLTSTVLQEGMEMRHVKRVVQPLVDGAFADEPIVLGLSTLGHHDEFTYMHAVNVCMIAVTMGRMLELDRRSLADLGVASLLHDVGKNSVADRIHHSIDEWSDEERAPRSPIRSRAPSCWPAPPRSTRPRCAACAWRSSTMLAKAAIRRSPAAGRSCCPASSGAPTVTPRCRCIAAGAARTSRPTRRSAWCWVRWRRGSSRRCCGRWCARSASIRPARWCSSTTARWRWCWRRIPWTWRGRTFA